MQATQKKFLPDFVPETCPKVNILSFFLNVRQSEMMKKFSRFFCIISEEAVYLEKTYLHQQTKNHNITCEERTSIISSDNNKSHASHSLLLSHLLISSLFGKILEIISVAELPVNSTESFYMTVSCLNFFSTQFHFFPFPN